MIKQKINIKIKNKDDYINKEHAYKAFGGYVQQKYKSDNT